MLAAGPSDYASYRRIGFVGIKGYIYVALVGTVNDAGMVVQVLVRARLMKTAAAYAADIQDIVLGRKALRVVVTARMLSLPEL